jgi:hypothetical protein
MVKGVKLVKSGIKAVKGSRKYPYSFVWILPWSQHDKTWGEFPTLEVAICMLHNFVVISKTA